MTDSNTVASSFQVHPNALCESKDIGAGTRVWAFAHIMPAVTIGDHCNIGDHAFVESGATIGDRVTIKNRVLIFEGVAIEDDVFVGPSVIFTNDKNPRSPRMPVAKRRYSDKKHWLCTTKVECGASLGGGAVIGPGVTIGRFAMIGMGAVVTKNVLAHALMVGHPARRIGWVCMCGQKLTQSFQCGCGISYVETERGLAVRSDV